MDGYSSTAWVMLLDCLVMVGSASSARSLMLVYFLLRMGYSSARFYVVC